MPDDLAPFADHHIVIVDDNRNFQQMLRAMLRGFGFRRIDTLSEASAFLPHLEHHAVDLALVDLVMTGTGGSRSAGIDLIGAARRSRTVLNRGMAAVLVTGHASRDVVRAAVAAGADHVLAKPLAPRNVLGAIRTILAGRRDYAAGRDGYYGPDVEAAKGRLDRRVRDFVRTGRYVAEPARPAPEAARAARLLQVPGFNVPLRDGETAFLD